MSLVASLRRRGPGLWMPEVAPTSAISLGAIADMFRRTADRHRSCANGVDAVLGAKPGVDATLRRRLHTSRPGSAARRSPAEAQPSEARASRRRNALAELLRCAPPAGRSRQ